MTEVNGKYDEELSAILVEQKSIIGFLSTIFDFLARRTDFYYVPKGQYENIGFPPGVAEELTVKVLRNCDPKRHKDFTTAILNEGNLTDDILCSTVAQEVEIEAEDDHTDGSGDQNEDHTLSTQQTKDKVQSSEPTKEYAESLSLPNEPLEPPKLPSMQRSSEAYNGAVRDNYSWAQSITDLDVTIHLPPDVKSSKDLNVRITALDLCVTCSRNKRVIVEGAFSFKVKAQETYWSLSGGRLLIHLEKQQERWWRALITTEEEIDLSKIDCSRPLDELPDDQVAKVRELQWNHERKMQGLPTSEDMRNMEILKKAWNLDGSPFKGKEFDPTVLRP